ncbi:MAG: 50S ribosomal protein L29 [Deltaproteobacteria bacterium]|nr:50S ribosomal protein L29 [Deltaproteobacteria bacterium]
MIELETLKTQSVGELVKLARKLQDELFQAKFQHATQQLKTPHKLRELKKDIARVKTIATQRRHEALAGKPVTPKPVKAAAPKVDDASKSPAGGKAPKAAKAPKADKPAAKAAKKKGA